MKPILLLLSSCFLAISAIGQESCTNAVEATLGTTLVVLNSGNDAPAPASCLNLMGDEYFLWYYFVATEDTTYSLTTLLSANTGLDTRVGVYTANVARCNALQAEMMEVEHSCQLLTSKQKQGSFFILFLILFGGLRTMHFRMNLKFQK